MIKGLIINVALSISFLLILSQFFSKYELTINSSYKIKILGGILGGVFGSILIVFSVLLTPTYMLDFRKIAIILVAFYGGWIPAIISGLIISFFRLFYLGINYMAVVGAISVQFVAIGCALISFINIKQCRKWTIMTAYSLIISIIVQNMFIKDLELLKQTILQYSIALSMLSFFVYYYSGYLLMSNKLIKKLKEESTRDFLTGLHNVRSFDKTYNDIIEYVTRRKKQLSILAIDIDYFKKINDEHGHHAGDMILKEFGGILTQTCRQFDIISRNGGEEFSVILIDCPSSKAYDIGERIRKAVEEHKFLLPDGNYINITVSIGVATFPDMTSDKELLLKLSDKALYKAKDYGRNKVCILN